MSSSHRDAVEMSSELNSISIVNMVHFFRRELTLVRQGRNASEVLSDSVILNFTLSGILKRVYWPKRHFLTEKGKNLLADSFE